MPPAAAIGDSSYLVEQVPADRSEKSEPARKTSPNDRPGAKPRPKSRRKSKPAVEPEDEIVEMDDADETREPKHDPRVGERYQELAHKWSKATTKRRRRTESEDLDEDDCEVEWARERARRYAAKLFRGGVALLIVAAISFVLPHFGLQFRMIKRAHDSQPIAAPLLLRLVLTVSSGTILLFLVITVVATVFFALTIL